MQLLNEKSFDKISLKDISIKAKINCGIFYACYDDKYDLMKKFQYKIIEDVTRNIDFSPFNFIYILKQNYDNIKVPSQLFSYISSAHLGVLQYWLNNM